MLMKKVEKWRKPFFLKKTNKAKQNKEEREKDLAHDEAERNLEAPGCDS